MHGIERTRKMERTSDENNRVRQIVFRYSDGRTLTFVPESGREFFSEDDMLELKRIVSRASATAEWAEAAGRAGGF